MSESGSKRRIEIVDRRERDEQAEQTAAAEESAADELLQDMPVEGGSSIGELIVEIEQIAQSADVGSEEELSQAADIAEGFAEHGLEFWQAQAQENLTLAMRKQAELENYRKLVAKDMDNARRFAVERLLTDLFPALDGLAQALSTYKDTADGENPLVDGMRRTARALESALSRHGIEKISAANVPFDGELHQPINVEDSSEVSEETVAEVYVDGYKLGGTVLKPAMVKVLKPA